MNIFEQYGIKEVANVTIYAIELDKYGDEVYVPVMYLDTLKISTLEQTAQQATAKGGFGNSSLITWDYGKEITLNLQDALFTPANQSLMWGAKFGINHSKIYGVWNPYQYPKDKNGKQIYIRKWYSEYCQPSDLYFDQVIDDYGDEDYDKVSTWRGKGNDSIKKGRIVVNYYAEPEDKTPTKILVVRLPYRKLDDNKYRFYYPLYDEKGQLIDENRKPVLDKEKEGEPIINQLQVETIDKGQTYYMFSLDNLNYIKDNMIVPCISFMENVLFEEPELDNLLIEKYISSHGTLIDYFESHNWVNIINEDYLLYKVIDTSNTRRWWEVPGVTGSYFKACFLEEQLKRLGYYNYTCPCTGERKFVLYSQNNGGYKYYKEKNQQYGFNNSNDQLDEIQRIVNWTGLYENKYVTYNAIPIQDNSVSKHNQKTGLYWYSKNNQQQIGETNYLSSEQNEIVKKEFEYMTDENDKKIITNEGHYLTLDGVEVVVNKDDDSKSEKFYDGLSERNEWHNRQMPEKAELIMENFADFEYNQSKLFYQPYEGQAENGVEQGPIPICRKLPFNVIMDKRWPQYAYSYTWKDCDLKMVSLQGEQDQYYLENASVKCYVPLDTGEKQIYLAQKVLEDRFTGNQIDTYTEEDMKLNLSGEHAGIYRYEYKDSAFLPKIDVYRLTYWPIPSTIDDDTYSPVTKVKVGTFYIIDEWNKLSSPPQDFIYEINDGIDNVDVLDRMETIIAKKTFAINVDRNLIMNNCKSLPQYKNAKLVVYIDPKTMKPYESNATSFECQNGQVVDGDLRIIKKDEVYLKWTRDIAKENETLGTQIIVDSKHYPGTYRIVGETFVRDRNGKDTNYQFEIPLCKLGANANLALEAAGDPVTFDMSFNVLRREDGVMVKFTQYETDCKKNIIPKNKLSELPTDDIEMDIPEDQIDVVDVRKIKDEYLTIYSPDENNNDYFYPYDSTYEKTDNEMPQPFIVPSTNAVISKKNLEVRLVEEKTEVNGIKRINSTTGETTYEYEDGATSPDDGKIEGYNKYNTVKKVRTLQSKEYSLNIEEEEGGV